MTTKAEVASREDDLTDCLDEFPFIFDEGFLELCEPGDASDTISASGDHNP
jgi:hypothetical protein